MHHNLLPISKNQIKFIHSLRQKKQRYKHNKYVLEGDKFVKDALANSPEKVVSLVIRNEHVITYCDAEVDSIFISDDKTFTELSTLTTPQNLMAVVSMDEEKIDDEAPLWMIIDRIQDPSNLGAIMRSCVWFGVRDMVLLKGTTDPFDSKTIQASAGTVLSMRVHYSTKEEFISSSADREIFALDMQGTPLRKSSLGRQSNQKQAIIVGNEGQGLDPYLDSSVIEKVTIPGHQDSVESLNAAVSTSIALYEWSL